MMTPAISRFIAAQSKAGFGDDDCGDILERLSTSDSLAQDQRIVYILKSVVLKICLDLISEVFDEHGKLSKTTQG